jgi:hypothetical protein
VFGRAVVVGVLLVVVRVGWVDGRLELLEDEDDEDDEGVVRGDVVRREPASALTAMWEILLAGSPLHPVCPDGARIEIPPVFNAVSEGEQAPDALRPGPLHVFRAGSRAPAR